MVILSFGRDIQIVAPATRYRGHIALFVMAYLTKYVVFRVIISKCSFVHCLYIVKAENDDIHGTIWLRRSNAAVGSSAPSERDWFVCVLGNKCPGSINSRFFSSKIFVINTIFQSCSFFQRVSELLHQMNTTVRSWYYLKDKENQRQDTVLLIGTFNNTFIYTYVYIYVCVYVYLYVCSTCVMLHVMLSTPNKSTPTLQSIELFFHRAFDNILQFGWRVYNWLILIWSYTKTAPAIKPNNK